MADQSIDCWYALRENLVSRAKMGEIFTRLLDFSYYSWLNIISNEIPFSFDPILFVNEEVNLLLKKEAIVQSSDEDNQFISNIFIVPKANENYRPVINLKYLMN